MKQHLSVLMLIVRSSIYKVIAALIAMAAVQAGLFEYALQKNLQSGGHYLENIVSKSGIAWVFAAAFLLLTYVISRTGCKNDSQPGYTIQRLGISERSFFIWQAVYNTAVYALLLGAELLLLMALARYWQTVANQDLIGAQSIFLAFYRNDFMHCICPLDDIWLWIRNGILAIAMGMAAAQYPFRQRRGKTLQVVVTMAAATLAFFVRGLGGEVRDFFAISMALIVIGKVVYNLWGGDENEEA